MIPLRRFAFAGFEESQIGLPVEVVPERRRARQGGLQRRPFVPLLGLGTEPVVEIFLEIGLELALFAVDGRARVVGGRLERLALG